MWKRMLRTMTSSDFELRERMLRTIIMVGTLATVIASVEILLVQDVANKMLVYLCILIFVMGLCQYITIRKNNVELAAMILGVVIVAVVMPFMFVYSAALNSGASVWLALGLFYVFVMFEGKKFWFFLCLTITSYALTFWSTYTFPQYIIEMPSRTAAYVDAFFSVLVVGSVCGMILKMHMRVYQKEHDIMLEQKEELQKSKDSKSAFFANMSHEIRTPINTIIGLNEMILRNHTTGETREYALDIQLASKLLLNQVNDILDLSQMEMQKMKIVPVEYKTTELVESLTEMIRLRMAKKNLEFSVDIDPTLPTVLYGDEKRLQQILLNLLDNAVKYTVEGGVTFSIQREDAGNGEIILKMKVSDTGIGIKKEDIEHIYDSFNRVDENKNSGIMGSGLGLAITKQLVDLMEGEIKIDSIYTKGTDFYVNIKQRVVDAESIGIIDFKEKRMDEGEIYQQSFESSEARILIVDDNRMNSMVATKLLAATKVQIDTAETGKDCLEMTKKKFYHVILLDYMMPVMNGQELMQAIRRQENGLCRNSAIIVLTGNTLSGAKEMYLDQGFDGYLEKPIQGKLLESEILRFLPPEIVEFRKEKNITLNAMSAIQRVNGIRKKKICVTADCACDIPQELLDKYEIELMYLYVRTPYGRFADTREIDSDSLTQYITKDKSMAYADHVTVEEYEEFFADVLTRAEQVVHIALAGHSGGSYRTAAIAAKGFDNVHVIDSYHISGGQGLVVLHAANLAQEGRSVADICMAVEEMRKHVETKFIMPEAAIFYQGGRARKVVANLCAVLQLHPMGEMKQNRAGLTGLLSGSLESAWKQGIRWQFRKKKKINTGILFITHVGLSVKQQNYIVNEVAKRIKFDKVIVQKASFSTACNVGLESVGFSFYVD